MTSALVLAYAAIGLGCHMLLLRCWQLRRVKRHPDDHISDFVLCVVFWPVTAWAVALLWRDAKRRAK